MADEVEGSAPTGGALSRRGFLGQTARLGLLAAMPAGLSNVRGLGFDQLFGSGITGTIVLGNYPGWIGKHEIAWFEQAYPGAKVRQAPAQSNSSSGTAGVVIQNPHEFDLVLTDATAAGQIAAGHLAGPFDHTKVPNLRFIKPQYVKMYPWGLPTDFGVTGIIYRKDIVKEPIKSLADFWKIAPKYSGRIALLDWDRQTMGITLRYLGYNSNTTDAAQMQKARDALIQLKKYILAFTPATATAKNLVGANPKAVLGISFDFDAGLFQGKEKNLVFVPPKEGMVGYIEGWQAISTTKHLDEVYALMNFHARPKATADFLRVSGTAALEPAASKLLPPAPQALRLPASAYASTQFAKFIGAKPLASITQYYEQVKSA